MIKEIFTPEEQKEYNCDEYGECLDIRIGSDNQLHHCGFCEEIFSESEMRHEIDFGWICDRCEAALKSQGRPLIFVEGDDDNLNIKDEEIEIKEVEEIDPLDTEAKKAEKECLKHIKNMIINNPKVSDVIFEHIVNTDIKSRYRNLKDFDSTIWDIDNLLVRVIKSNDEEYALKIQGEITGPIGNDTLSKYGFEINLDMNALFPDFYCFAPFKFPAKNIIDDCEEIMALPPEEVANRIKHLLAANKDSLI